MSQHIDPTPKQTDIASLNAKTAYTVGNAKLEVYGGHVCVLQMNNVQIISDAVIIPQQFRPSYTIWSAVGVTDNVTITNNDVTSLPRAAVEPNGSVLVQINGSNRDANVRGQIVWVI